MVYATSTMKRAIVLLALIIALATGVTALITRQGQGALPLYSPAQVQAGLALRPARWIGRTVLVRGSITQVGWSEQHVAYQIDGDPNSGPIASINRVPPPGTIVEVALTAEGASLPLRFVAARPDPWRAMLHRLPLIGALFPAPRWTSTTGQRTFRVRLLRPACPGCDAGLLLGGLPASE